MKLTDITAFNDVQTRLQSLSPHQIRAVERSFSAYDPDSEVSLGSIQSESSRAMYALVRILHAESVIEEAHAGISIEPEEETEHKVRSQVLHHLSDVTYELFWFQVRSELGVWKKNTNLTICTDWLLVAPREDDDDE